MSKPRVSVIIPVRNEIFLQRTIQDVLAKAKGDIEVIAVCDGYRPPKEEIVKDDRVIYIFKGEAEGMRPGINDGVAIAKGEFILKTDGHCMFSEDWDRRLAAVCEPNWMVTPLRRRLDPVKWEIQPQPPSKPDISYHYLSYPQDPADWGGAGLNGKIWTEKILATQDRGEFIDDLAAAQGSAWFMPKKLYEDLGLLDTKSWGPFWAENQEQTFSVVLKENHTGKDGASKIYTGVWYAHWHKGKPKQVELDGQEKTIGGRGYSLREQWLQQGRNMAMKFFAGQKVWKNQKYPLSHLIEMHMPMPEWTTERLNELKDRERKNGWNI